MLLCSYARHKDTQTQSADSAVITAERREDGGRRRPSLISSSNVPASLITPCALRSSFTAGSACPECPRGGCRMTSAPADPQSCCHPSSPRSPSWMVWSPSNRGQGSPLVDQRLLGKSIDTPRSNLASALPAWLADYSPPFPSLHFPLLPCYGQMKTMQFSLFHTSPCVDILLQDKKCLCLPGARSSRRWCICPVNWPPFPPVFGLRGGETAINQISERGFVFHHGIGREEVLTEDYAGAQSQPSLRISFSTLEHFWEQ